MDKLLATIKDHYGLDLQVVEKVTRGFLSENHILATRNGETKYFLKRYRFDTEEKIAEIHIAKKYFTEKGIPIILPIPQHNNTTYVNVDGAYFAIFPYVDGRHIDRDDLSPTAIISLGETLGAIHLAGKDAAIPITGKFEGWNKEKLLARNTELQTIIRTKSELGAFDENALKDLELRRNIIENNTKTFEDFYLLSDHLIHGDYHGDNVFFDTADHVSFVFDLEKSIYAPRTFELFRSMTFLFCKNEFSDIGIANARLYVQSYLRIYLASREELRAGLQVFFLRFVHGFWVQNEHYLKGNTRVDQFLVQDYHRVQYLATHLDELEKALFD